MGVLHAVHYPGITRLMPSWSWKPGLLEELIMFRRHFPEIYRVCLFGIAHPEVMNKSKKMSTAVQLKLFLTSKEASIPAMRKLQEGLFG
ncbi:hypothetical protein Trydic_g10053 [Trypoxylus dichotomus]